MKETLTNYFGNEFDVPPGLSHASCRGLPNNSLKLWGTDIIGYQLTSNVKNNDVQVLGHVICDTRYGPRHLWIGNHKGISTIAPAVSWQWPFKTTGEVWIEYDLYNPTPENYVAGYELQINIYTAVPVISKSRIAKLKQRK